jgi:hypothetical protein
LDGTLEGTQHPDLLSLLSGSPGPDVSIKTIAASALERTTCAVKTRESPFMQYPGSYARALVVGSFAGILNRARCHVGCGRDIVWIERDLCLLWIRTFDHLQNLDWIKFFPFRLDRSGPRGRLLSKFAQTKGGTKEEWSSF